jgi:hypothetical protein
MNQMRNIFLKVIVAAAVTAIGMFGADSSFGTWKLNTAKSKSTSTNPVKSQTDVREATPDGRVKLTRTSQLMDGTTVSYSATFKYDGKEYPATGAPYDFVAVKRIDANTTTYEVRKSGGKYHLNGKNIVSKDGKTLTQTSEGTDADGKPVKTTNIFDRQ